MYIFYIIQILTGVKSNIDYISSRGTKNCPTRSGGQYIRPKGANIINVARKHSQHLFCYMKKQTKNQERIWKQIDVIFLAQHRVHEFSFAQSSFPKYRRHQKVTGDIPLSVGTRLKMFYLILLHNNSQIHIPVMITNHRIARPLFCLPWLIAYCDVTLFWSREGLFTSPFTNQQIRGE